MKKNILKVAFVAAFALVAGYGVHTAKAQTNLSELALDNVEALAKGESGATACCVSPGDYCKTDNGDILLDHVECNV